MFAQEVTQGTCKQCRLPCIGYGVAPCLNFPEGIEIFKDYSLIDVPCIVR